MSLVIVRRWWVRWPDGPCQMPATWLGSAPASLGAGQQRGGRCRFRSAFSEAIGHVIYSIRLDHVEW